MRSPTPVLSRFCGRDGRGGTWLFVSQVVPEVAFLPLVGAHELAEDGFVEEQVLVEVLPVRDKHVLVHLEGDAVGPVKGGVLAGDRSQRLRDIFCNRAAENGKNLDSVESVQPAQFFFDYGALLFVLYILVGNRFSQFFLVICVRRCVYFPRSVVR